MLDRHARLFPKFLALEGRVGKGEGRVEEVDGEGVGEEEVGKTIVNDSREGETGRRGRNLPWSIQG